MPSLLIPVLGLVAYSPQLVCFLGLERVTLEVIVVSCVQLRQGFDAIVLEHVAEGS